ncbi:MAG: hypothetical protein H6810_05355 [Phycisphaeraceae bacterium]|nr:MAG: hypothetical protein H6810_05355 [Phycisphaeraceae bacterium]
MKGDAQSYGRATGVAILGLILQAVCAAMLAVYAAFAGGDHAAVTAAWHVGVGLLVWAPLIVLFDLHRRERREAVEIERLAQEESTGVFEGVEQPRAARTLEAMQRFALPILSLIVGGSLLTVGLVRLGSITEKTALAETITLHKGWGIAVGLAIAIAGFVFARFVSGMATQRIWAPLRAGASYAVGSALLGLAVAVTQFIDSSMGRSVALDPVSHAVPIFSILLGAETLVNVVLDIYRPRKPGEDPRPGFDSRLLGLLAAPDKIAENIGEALNYQFGVEVSKTWFYLLIQRWWPGLIAVALLVTWGMTSLVVIEPHQRALILTFGKPSAPLLSFGDRKGDEVGPGLHVVAPWPMTEVYVPVSRTLDEKGKIVETHTSTGVRMFNLGTNPPKTNMAILWTNEHALNEVYSLVQPAGIGDRGTATMPAGEGTGGDRLADLSLVAVEAPVQYVIDDVKAFDELAQPGQRHELLKVLGQRELLHYLASKNIDDVLGSGRIEMGVGLRERLERSYSDIYAGRGGAPAPAGIRIMNVGSGAVHPPKDAARSFERVVQAQQVLEAKVEAATEDKIRILTEVAPPIVRDDGTTVSTEDIVARIVDLSAMRARGVSSQEIAERELEVQHLLEEAGGEAGASLIEASAQRWNTHMGERGRAALFKGQAAGYAAAPALYKSQRYFEALLDIMRGSRVYLTSEQLTNLKINIELQTRDTGIDLFNPEAGSENQP